MALVLLSMCFLGLGSWLRTVTWIETLVLTFIHPSLYILLLIRPSLSHISISISIYNISICFFVVAAYPCNPSHPGALTRCKPSCTDQQCGPAKHSRTMTNDCDRSHSVMSRHNYMRKRNWQLYWSSMESQTVLFDSRRCTMVRQDALWWNWMSQAKMRASTSLRQFWLTHADALHFQIVFAPIWLHVCKCLCHRWQVTGKVCTAPRQDGPTSQDRSECKVCCLNLLDTLELILNVRAVTARVWKTLSHDWLIGQDRSKCVTICLNPLDTLQLILDFRAVTTRVWSAPSHNWPICQDRSKCLTCSLNLLDTFQLILDFRAVTARIWKTPSHDWLIG